MARRAFGEEPTSAAIIPLPIRQSRSGDVTAPSHAREFVSVEIAVLECAAMNDESTDNADLKYWVAFGRIPRIGRARFSLLEKHFGRLENAWTACAAELRAAGLDQASITSIVAARPEISPDDELERSDAPTSTPSPGTTRRIRRS